MSITLPSLRELYGSYTRAPPAPDRGFSVHSLLQTQNTEPDGQQNAAPASSDASASLSTPYLELDYTAGTPAASQRPPRHRFVDNSSVLPNSAQQQQRPRGKRESALRGSERRSTHASPLKVTFAPQPSDVPRPVVYHAGVLGPDMTSGYSAASIATHTAAAHRSMTTSNIPKFAIVSRDTAGNESHSGGLSGSGRGSGSRAKTVAPACTRSMSVFPAAPRQHSPTPKRSCPSSPLGAGQNKAICKRRHQRTLSNASTSSSTSSLAAVADFIAANSLDSLDSLDRDSRADAALPADKPAHGKGVTVSAGVMTKSLTFTVNHSDSQTLVFGGHGLEQTVEISPVALAYGAAHRALYAQQERRKDEVKRAGLVPIRVFDGCDSRDSRDSREAVEVGGWSAVRSVPLTPPPTPVMGLAKLATVPVADPITCTQVLPPLSALTAHRSDRLNLPPIQSAGPFSFRKRLDTMQPDNQAGPSHPLQRTAPASAAFRGMRHPLMTQASSSASSASSASVSSPPGPSEDDLRAEEHIYGLEAAIRAGAAKRRVMADNGSSHNVVVIPPDAAASVAAVLSNVMRRQSRSSLSSLSSLLCPPGEPMEVDSEPRLLPGTAATHAAEAARTLKPLLPCPK